MENAFAKLDYENKPTVMIMDRGTLDGRAFLSDNNWTRLLVAERTNEAALLARYDAVIHMTTAAEGAEEYYVNDPVRNETPEQAREIDARLVRAYAAHPRRYIVTSGADFGVKISTALGHVEKEVTALIAETMGFK
jgi:predicted ATPase